MLYDNVLYYTTLLYHTILYYTILPNTIPCQAMPYHAVPYSTRPHHSIPYRTITVSTSNRGLQPIWNLVWANGSITCANRYCPAGKRETFECDLGHFAGATASGGSVTKSHGSFQNCVQNSIFSKGIPKEQIQHYYNLLLIPRKCLRGNLDITTVSCWYGKNPCGNSEIQTARAILIMVAIRMFGQKKHQNKC